MSFLTQGLAKLFGSKSARDIKEIKPIVDQINKVYATIANISDEALREKTQEIKGKIKEYLKSIDDQLAELHSQIDSDTNLDIHAKEALFEQIDKLEESRDQELEKVLMCSGKIYYDLQERQEKEKRTDIAIVRLEQLHPFPANQINTILAQYKGAELIWVQEEPENMGYWTYILRVFKDHSLKLISRKASASPATGYAKVHAAEQQKLVDQAFA